MKWYFKVPQKMADRIDKEMVNRGLVKTRSQASMLISQGDVFCNGQKVTKTGLKVSEADTIEINQDQLYVSRGAYKLKKAIAEFELDFNDKVIADVGASTGGFTQVSLEAGAKKVYAIDVGHDQLNDIVKENPKVINLEGTNIKFPLELPEKVDFCVVDLSFISIRRVFENIACLLNDNGKVMALIKPQFEAGKERMGKNGLIKDSVRDEVIAEVKQWFLDNNYEVEKESVSPIVGNKSGNVEYLYLIKKSGV